MLILRIIEKLLVIYFGIYVIIDLSLFVYSFFVFARKDYTSRYTKEEYAQHPISIIVPAYNEEVTVVECAKMLLNIDYPAYEVIIVNDGSADHTMEELMQAFDLTSVSGHAEYIRTAPVRRVYEGYNNTLKVIDKANGGKADSINAGINNASGKYICTIDADSILDSQALKDVVDPFFRDENTIVSGGYLAPSNDLIIQNDQVVNSKIPANIWVLWQIIEYIKSLLISRTGLSRINALLIMSGAFSLYRKADLSQIGGFLSPVNDHPYIQKYIGTGQQTVCEDMEVVVRLFHYCSIHKRKAKTAFLPKPVCWTEVPDNAKNLFKQRSRWHQGLTQVLALHKHMLFEPRFGITGMIAMPYYMFFELLVPLIKVFTIIFLIVSAFYGLLNYYWLLLLLLGIMVLSAIIMSSITAIVEYWSMNQSQTNREALRYKTFTDWCKLIFAGIIGEIYYAFFKIFAQVAGFMDFFKRESNWKKFERKGLQEQ